MALITIQNTFTVSKTISSISAKYRAMPKAKTVRGRQPGFKMSDEHRVKIQNSNILNALVEHVGGKRDMSATQVSAGIALLKKVLPDLSAVTVSGDPEAPIQSITRIELVAEHGNRPG